MLLSSKIPLLILGVVALVGCNQDQHSTSGAGVELEGAFLARTASVSIQPIGSMDPAAIIPSPMPTGVAVSPGGRLFVCFPRWGDEVPFTVGELKNGRVVAYPSDKENKIPLSGEDENLISVQSVVADDQNRLWILDTTSVNMGQIVPSQAKLVCVDLNTNRVVKVFHFSDGVIFPTSYLNDVRFDFSRGPQGMAFISDSSDSGPNGIVVLDLYSGKSWRKLNDHPSTKADPDFQPLVEGQALLSRPINTSVASPLKVGIDGIAIDSRKGLLYYCPLASRRLQAVSISALADPNLPDEEVAKNIDELPVRDFASDGLLCDNQGNLYLTDYEHNAIRRLARGEQGRYETVVSDSRMIWPDSMALGPGNTLYFTVNQLNRSPRFHRGQDFRQPPFAIFRAKIGGQAMAMP